MRAGLKRNLKIMVSIVALSAMLTVVLAGCKKSERKLADGNYAVSVTLTGGSGKSTIKSPADVIVENGEIKAYIEWSSPNYDYMILDGEKYLPVNSEGNSVFEIPLNEIECTIDVTADTVAMSKPHEIEYTIEFSMTDKSDENDDTESETDLEDNTVTNSGFDKEEIETFYANHKVTEKLELKYAKKYHVICFEDRYCMIEINGTDYYLLNSNGDIPSDLPECVTVIDIPLNKIYVVSTASMDYFSSLDALENVKYTSFKKEELNNKILYDLMDSGKIKYAGKYSAPDYEMLVSEGCDLVIENTMIGHSPAVLDQLHKLSLNTIIDYSSKESSPLGRMEWIKLYGLLTGKSDEAQKIFEESEKRLLGEYTDTGKSAAYFYITNSGGVVVRKGDDYIARLIEMAGGHYIFSGNDTYKGSGQMTIQKEAFFEEALNCDYLIYNSTITGEIESADELAETFSALKNTKAYKEGNIFCTRENIYLDVMELPEIAEDFNRVFGGKEPEKYLFRMK